MYQKPMNQSLDTTVATPVADGANALHSPLPQTIKQKATVGESSRKALGPHALSASTK